ncbi:PREDICTED: probable rRNA-processing protein EBP2 homolog [Dufourea novaeangliae]|uniref:Putative rRNA-processing protein EBP2 like protein n=1 Tax=Dufourea novaeangliae TaxID=178035 RepID=A0A154P7M1_DUFNO|nr:PREDICTED: probable rRNA-processing protein EBP2 homolog [Dufourea novaeangliae]KZC07862.1 putative rRNA-processing protein EBP2 like protein [Dufourea novaeangliae]
MKLKKATKKAAKVAASSDSDSEYSSDEELREAFAKGLIKPGLNTVTEEISKKFKNSVNLMKQKLDAIKLNLPWLERLDMVNAPAPLAPELALQMQEQEVRRAKQLKGNKKLPQYTPSEDPVLNDFRRETMFHRQAQGAVLDGIIRLKKLGVPTIRPDDYFAEMAKSDTHMQKVRQNLMKKQTIAQRSEKIRSLRQQRKVSKQMQVEATLKKHAEKRKLMEEVKKYRKGVRKDLDFLEDKKKPQRKGLDQKAAAKRKMKDSKYGFGGKKRGNKKNTKSSSADVSEYKRPSKPGKDLKKKGGKPNPRLGKNRRIQMKAKKRRQ